jgi:hypothetical protein
MARIRIDDLPVADNLTPEQEDLIQGAGLKSFRPRFEVLEDRQVMSAHLGAALPPMKAPVLGPAAFSTSSIPASPQGGTVLQRELQTAIAGQGGRVDLQQVGKLILGAAQREANALWGDKVVAGRVKFELREVTPFDHGVRVHFWLSEVIGARDSAESGFEVNIKYDDKGAVTAESAVRRLWGHEKDIPFIQNMSKALGAPEPPPEAPPTLAEGFL